MSPAPNDEALSRRFNGAVVEHFGAADHADAEEVMLAGCTVVASYIAGVRDPVARGVLLAQAQWTLGRVVAGIVGADAGKGGPKGRDRRGP